MTIPVVIAANGKGIPVVEASDGIGVPVTVVESGLGIPVVVADGGVGMPVVGLVTPDPSAPVISSVDITPPGGTVGTEFRAVVSVSGYPRPILEYQWFLDSDPIAGATGQTYLSTDAGELSVEVTATNAEGEDIEDADPVTVEPAPEPMWFASFYWLGFSIVWAVMTVGNNSGAV